MTVAIQQLMWRVEGIRDAFHQAVYDRRNVDAAMQAAGCDCRVDHLPVGAGADSGDLRRFLGEVVIPHLPADLAFRRVTRTLDQRRVVEETAVSFVHDRHLPWLLPGVAPTGKQVEVCAISIASFKHTTHLGDITTRMTSYRTRWDCLTLLSQLDIHPEQLRRLDPSAG